MKPQLDVGISANTGRLPKERRCASRERPEFLRRLPMSLAEEVQVGDLSTWYDALARPRWTRASSVIGTIWTGVGTASVLQISVTLMNR